MHDERYDVRFAPIRPPTRPARVAILLVGPLLWIAGLVIVAIAANQTHLIWLGLVIAAASFLVGIVFLLLARAKRLREEGRPAPRS
jgi:hypothetical protein